MSPGYPPDPRIEPVSLMSPSLAGGFFTTSTTWEAQYAGHIMKMLGWKKHKLESRLPEVSITSDMQMTPPLWQKTKKN